MVIRKTAEQIKEEILSCLNDSPLSVEQIRLRVESNWSTVSSYLDELTKEGKVKEIISADKAKIYQRVLGDTYFDIPISMEERKKFKTLFSIIIKKYKEENLTPNKTQLAKTAVKVIKSSESGLTALPIVEYLYGIIPLMIADPSKEYSEELEFENRHKIDSIIKMYIKENFNKKTKQITEEHHKEYCDRLYLLNDEFLKLTEDQKWDKPKISEILNEFFIACPIDTEFKEIFGLTDRFISIVRKLSHFDDLDKHRTIIRLTFESIWKFIATYNLYQSMKTRVPDKNILNLYLGNALFVRKTCAEESLSDLYSVYWSKIDVRELNSSEESNRVKEIMQGWTGED
ncbi:MAG: hypothetical protein AABX11_01300 [Nanoarchaeota archaeon]